MPSTRLATLALTALTVLTVLAAVTPVAEAQDDTAAAREVFNEAARQFEARNYALALPGFTRAYEMLRAVGYARAGYTLYNIGRCNEELGRVRAARDAYQRFISEADEQAPYRSEVRDRIRDLEARLEVSGEGAEAGGASTLAWVGWLVAGVGGAAAISGVVTGVLAIDRGDQLASRCPGFMCGDAADQSLIDEADTLAVATDVLLISGLIVAAGGVALALVLDLGADDATPTAGCTGDGCVVGLRQSF